MDLKLIFQIILSITLVILIGLQSSDAGLGRAWGGGNIRYSSKKGIEKSVFYSTILVSFLFVVMAIINNLF
ncbi:preprotein translocase subunit SecG [Candidatus Collierbacteria bacterium RIFOXYB1_FULL_49_13]|uniref:Protein-export membrane protein SecG n=1 Tax=Candidatus Collierbacteria bacterium RIFOXYB1_FULL_49_13 TaxID=1817728 RepID=A0A1F5FFK7_9BACT|nr:MAG: preprotein translocase subunit SecG [Candidatus Collierbacteria bacterium RIFOXYB1_FULL_49_13]